MRPSHAAAAVLLASCTSSAQQQAGNHLWRSYDELEACTTVHANVFTREPRGGQTLFTLDVFALHADTAPAGPFREVALTFGMEHDEERSPLGGQSPRLSLVADDSVRLRYQGRSSRPFPAQHLPGGMLERVYFRIPIEDFPRIARASAVSGQVGTTGFALDAGQVAVLRQLADYVARSPDAVVPQRDRELWGMDCDSHPWSPNHADSAR